MAVSVDFSRFAALLGEKREDARGQRLRSFSARGKGTISSWNGQPFFYCFTFSIWEADSVRSKVTDREANSEPMTFWAAARTSAAAT